MKNEVSSSKSPDSTVINYGFKKVCLKCPEMGIYLSNAISGLPAVWDLQNEEIKTKVFRREFSRDRTSDWSHVRMRFTGQVVVC